MQSRSVARSLIVVSLLTPFAFMAGCGASTEPAFDVRSRLPNWTAEESETSMLASEVEVEGYRICPPKGFEKQEGGRGSEKVVTWLGERREDGTAPSVIMIVSTNTMPELQVNPTAAKTLETLFGGFETRHLNLKQSASEMGTINGLEFARASYTATIEKIDIQGMMYALNDGDNIVQLHVRDSPAFADDLKIGEASILSFNK